MLIFDNLNHAIRKITPGGVITTLAGTGVAGSTGDGGQATAARLNSPADIALDASGALYIADRLNNRIRKVATNGVITTVAGSVSGFSGDGGQATSAQLNRPRSVAFDPAGNMYIADSTNDRIRKIDTSGVITTIAGSTSGFSGDGGSATGAQLANPSSIAVNSGNIYINDQTNRRIRKIDSFGTITTVVGFAPGKSYGDGGPATQATFGGPARSPLITKTTVTLRTGLISTSVRFHRQEPSRPYSEPAFKVAPATAAPL